MILHCFLGIDELLSLHVRFCTKVNKFAPDSILFQAEIKRLAEEIKVLTEKARCWDVLISYGRTLTERDESNLSSDSRRIFNSFKFLERLLAVQHELHESDPGRNGGLGEGNDTMYSSSDSNYPMSPHPSVNSTPGQIWTQVSHRSLPLSLLDLPDYVDMSPESGSNSSHSGASVIENRNHLTSTPLGDKTPMAPSFASSSCFNSTVSYTSNE